jgi:transforming growth factor-beta-induced protein
MCVGAFAATASLSLFGCSDDSSKSTSTSPPTASKTIAELVVANDGLSVLRDALTAAGLVNVFNQTDGDKFTVFAPTNDAFYKHNDTVNCLLYTDPAELPNVLKYHVVKDAIESNELKNESVPTLLSGESLKIAIEGGSVMVNNATVTTADIAASNGEVHLINDVLIPSNFDASKCPTASIAKTAEYADLNMLVAALNASDLVSVFSTVDLATVYTVFAPTDDAFKAVDSVVQCLLKPENKDKLVELLKYHVAAGYTTASELSNGESIPTLDGSEELKVQIDGSSVMINDATVQKADVATTNGVVHVIDKVLVPAGFSCGQSDSITV